MTARGPLTPMLEIRGPDIYRASAGLAILKLSSWLTLIEDGISQKICRLLRVCMQ